MSGVDFWDQEQAKAWFSKQTYEMRCVMASRAAIRVIAAVDLAGTMNNEALSLTALRATLTASCLGLGRLEDQQPLQRAASAAANSRSALMPLHNASAADRSRSVVAHKAAFAAARCTYATDANAYEEAAEAIRLSTSAHPDQRHLLSYPSYTGENRRGVQTINAFRASALSATTADSQMTPRLLLQTAVWNSEPTPDGTIDAHNEWLDYLESNSDWAFWLRWYREMWNGTFKDWDLAVEVAKLEGNLWEVNDAPEKVAVEIGKIESKLRVRTAIADLRNGFETMVKQSDRHGIGGNNPPECMQIEPEIVQEITIIWAAVDELQVETEKESSDKSAVLRIIEELRRGLKAVLAFIGRMIEHATEVAITSVVSAGTATLLARPELLEPVIEAAKAWLPFLP